MFMAGFNEGKTGVGGSLAPRDGSSGVNDASLVTGVGVGAESFRIAVFRSIMLKVIDLPDSQATLPTGAASVYFVRLGRGLDGKLGGRCSGAGVASALIVLCSCIVCSDW